MAAPPKRGIVVVLGMHRSGTSAVARSLPVMGVDLGNNLMPAFPGNNDKGFWEDLDILDLNEELLEHLGVSWDSLEPAFPKRLNEIAIAPFRQRARDLIRRKTDHSEWFGMKDPRVARLLPFWRGVFASLDLDVRYVVVFRNPLSVAASLARRDGFTKEKSLYLWLQHTIPSIVETRGCRRAFVDYDSLVEESRHEIYRVASSLGMAERIDETELDGFCTDFFEAGLRHTRFDAVDLAEDAAVPALAAEVFATLNLFASGALLSDSAEAAASVAAFAGELERLAPALRFMAVADARCEESARALTCSEGEIAGLKGALADPEQAINELRRAGEAMDAHIATLNRTIVELNEALSESQLQLGELLASTSWRVTAPLREVRMLYEYVRSRGVLRRHRHGTSTAFISSLDTIDPSFDARFYVKAYPDVARAEIDARHHYVTQGAKDGRVGSLPIPAVYGNLQNLSVAKPTVLVISHEASRTGAPILALNIAQHLRSSYNVVAILLGSGALIDDFREACDVVVGPLVQARNPFITGEVIARLLNGITVTFAIVNSIESRVVLPSLARLFVPTLCLVHEFAAYTRPLQAFSDVAFWASQVVFSARIVKESAEEACPALRDRGAPVLPQGRSLAPQPTSTEGEYAWEARRVRRALRPASHPVDTVVILGAGSVHSRKGVDLFLATAAKVVALAPSNAFYFVWVGHGFDPVNDTVYSVYLRDQMHRAKLDAVVAFVGEFPHIDLAYELADVLFLSSRLDPLPNVAIDAAHYKLPTVCFDRTTGIADVLAENGLGDACVAGYLDIDGAARRLVALIDDADLRVRIGEQFQSVGARLFDMESYVASLGKIALRCAHSEELERQDCAEIEQGDDLRVDFVGGPAAPPRPEVVRSFVRSWASRVHLRKPFPGFHPGIYEDLHGVAQEGKNPLADFVAAGRPDGPWLCDVITPAIPIVAAAQRLRVALHIHAYYPDLVPDILRRLEQQELDLHLLISVPSPGAADEVGSMLSSIPGLAADVRVVPNRGRDIAPLLTEFGAQLLAHYDIVGHIHTKKTAEKDDPEMGRVWREFLLANLVGGQEPMAARILGRMEADHELGLVFPDDPHVWGWTENKPVAAELAAGLGISDLPDKHFWFPIGTMFWARVQAIAPLLRLPWGWDDYPDEPLAADGTSLHAIERLLPVVAEATGYRIALTNVPGVTR